MCCILSVQWADRRYTWFFCFWQYKRMKVLFVCRANSRRIQVAMEFFRRLGGKADSAGTKVNTVE